jgi:phosphate starvation-inducible PhoH-like protein
MGRAQRRQASHERPSRKARTTPEKSGYGEFTSITTKELAPKTERQREMMQSIYANIMTLATGCAGAGKSHIAVGVGAQFLKTKAVQRLIFTKPDFEIDSKLGILPGDKDEKMAVLMGPIRSLLIKTFGRSHFENLLRLEQIIFEPLGSILGHTYDDSFVFIDEAQYSTEGQMKVLLSRLGERSKIVVAGDYKEQRLLSKREQIEGRYGLEDVIRRFGHHPNVGHIDFEPDDIVRSGFTKQVILAYREDLGAIA